MLGRGVNALPWAGEFRRITRRIPLNSKISRAPPTARVAIFGNTGHVARVPTSDAPAPTSNGKCSSLYVSP